MLAGMQRHPDPGHQANLAGPHAGAVDHVLGLDGSALGLDAADPAVGPMNGGDFDVFEDLGAAHARALGQRHGRVDRVGLAILGQEHGADQVLDVEQGVEVPRLRRGDDRNLEARQARHGRAAFQFLEALLIARDRKASVLLEARGLARFLFQVAVEAGRVHGQLGEVQTCA